MSRMTMRPEEVAEPSVAGPGCALKRVLDIVGGKWKILVLCAIYQREPVRYGELRKMIFGITNTMLANSLKELEADGLVTRTVYANEMPLRVEYSLTGMGSSIIPILLELKDWGVANLN